MVVLEVLVFIAFSLSKVDGQRIETGLVPVTHKPLDGDQIFNIRTSTASQCIYVCIQNKKCMTAVYDSPGSMCFGYRSQNDEERLSEDVKGWRVTYSGQITASMSSLIMWATLCL